MRYLMRPVPVVRRPIAFTDQLSERKRGKGGRVSVRSGIVGGASSPTLGHCGPFRGGRRDPAGYSQLRLRAEG